jgi:hypothetical protein
VAIPLVAGVITVTLVTVKLLAHIIVERALQEPDPESVAFASPSAHPSDASSVQAPDFPRSAAARTSALTLAPSTTDSFGGNDDPNQADNDGSLPLDANFYPAAMRNPGRIVARSSRSSFSQSSGSGQNAVPRSGDRVRLSPDVLMTVVEEARRGMIEEAFQSVTNNDNLEQRLNAMERFFASSSIMTLKHLIARVTRGLTHAINTGDNLTARAFEAALPLLHSLQESLAPTSRTPSVEETGDAAAAADAASNATAASSSGGAAPVSTLPSPSVFSSSVFDSADAPLPQPAVTQAPSSAPPLSDASRQAIEAQIAVPLDTHPASSATPLADSTPPLPAPAPAAASAAASAAPAAETAGLSGGTAAPDHPQCDAATAAGADAAATTSAGAAAAAGADGIAETAVVAPSSAEEDEEPEIEVSAAAQDAEGDKDEQGPDAKVAPENDDENLLEMLRLKAPSQWLRTLAGHIVDYGFSTFTRRDVDYLVDVPFRFKSVLLCAVGVTLCCMFAARLFANMELVLLFFSAATALFALIKCPVPDASACRPGDRDFPPMTRATAFITFAVLALVCDWASHEAPEAHAAWRLYDVPIFSSYMFEEASNLFQMLLLALPLLAVFTTLASPNLIAFWLIEQLHVHVFGGSGLPSLEAAVQFLVFDLAAVGIVFAITVPSFLRAHDDGEFSFLASDRTLVVPQGLLAALAWMLASVAAVNVEAYAWRHGWSRVRWGAGLALGIAFAALAATGLYEAAGQGLVNACALAVVSLGFVFHYLGDHFRKSHPFTLLKKPLVTPKEASELDVHGPSHLTRWEVATSLANVLETFLFNPLLVLCAVSLSARNLLAAFGPYGGAMAFTLAGMKGLRIGFSEPGQLYYVVAFTWLFGKYDGATHALSYGFAMDFFFMSILLHKVRCVVQLASARDSCAVLWSASCANSRSRCSFSCHTLCR